jgi:hypothetical protein
MVGIPALQRRTKRLDQEFTSGVERGRGSDEEDGLVDLRAARCPRPDPWVQLWLFQQGADAL